MRTTRAREATITTAIVLLTIVGIIAYVLFTPWLLMVVLGALHSAFPAIPALGFGVCVLICVLLAIVGGFFRSNG